MAPTSGAARLEGGAGKGGPRPAVRAILVLLLASVAYVALGFFVDLPPYGIWLEGSDSRLVVDGTTVRVEAHLRYVCTSWRPRRTAVWLPFSPDGSPPRVRDLAVEVPEGTTWEARPDGVILHLAMAPGSRQGITARYSQDLSGRTLVYLLAVGRGWSIPAEMVSCVVDLPGDASPRFAPPTVTAKEVEGDSGRRVFEIPRIGPEGLEVAW